MSEPAPQNELLRSLGQLVRGLSALFWGLPLTLLVCVRTAISDWLRPIGILPPLLATGLLLFGLWQIGYFQPQERIWRRALDRATLLGMIVVGLSPFVFWWNRIPQVPFYSFSVGLLMLCGLLFLIHLNYVLQRLTAMLPDETLRMEAHWFTTVNLGLLVATLTAVSVYFLLLHAHDLVTFVLQLLRIDSAQPMTTPGAFRPAVISNLLHQIEPIRALVLVFLVLVPLALTMTLIWKVKEVVLNSVFSTNR